MSQSIYQEYGISHPKKRYQVPEKTVRKHLSSLEEYGFTREEVRALVKKMPAVLGCTAERTSANLKILKSIDCDVLSFPMQLMWAPDHLRGRIAFLKNAGLPTNARLVFPSVKEWKELFGHSRAELIVLGEESTEHSVK